MAVAGINEADHTDGSIPVVIRMYYVLARRRA